MRIWLSLVAVAACSDPAPTILTDAAPQPDADETVDCLIEGDYGALGTVTGTAAMGGMTATLDPGPPRDSFYLKLVSGKGAFSGGLATGTFTISGADASYTNCGLCVHIIADIVTGQGPSKFYFAESGTVTLTSTAAPISGSAQNLHLRSVDINTGELVDDGCEATIASMTFSTN